MFRIYVSVFFCLFVCLFVCLTVCLLPPAGGLLPSRPCIVVRMLRHTSYDRDLSR